MPSGRKKTYLKCIVEGCEQTKIHGRGYCNLHYDRWLNGRDLNVPIIRFKHLLCTVEGCTKNRVSEKYCNGHSKRLREGRSIDATPLQLKKKRGNLSFDGYIEFSINGRTRPQHVWMAIAALGKPLPKGAEVHHVNGIRYDNRPENLVICPNRAYHSLIEKRTKALNASGHADWVKCSICKEYDDPSNFKFCKKSAYNDNRNHLTCTKVPRPNRLKMEEMNELAMIALSFGS